MRCLAAFLTLVCLAEARPRRVDAVPSISFDPYILGGVEATPGEFPWQLSQEQLSGPAWSHNCGASLLTPNSALSAAHCVDGRIPSNLRVIAGLHSRSDQTYAQIAEAISYKKVAINTSPAHIGVLTLPPDNTELFVGITCTLSGWGRISSSSTLPDALHKVDIPVISTEECDMRTSTVIGADCTDAHIAVYDVSNSKGSCNGDSGGPMNCPLSNQTVVAGVTSWGISGGGDCLPEYPSVYTRTGYYLDWIILNTPSP